jgi:predicted ATPase
MRHWPGIVAVAAAIANAVHHASGKRVRDLPMTLDKVTRSLISAVLAEVEAEAGHLEEGLATLDAQLAENADTGQWWFDAEVQRVRGELLLRREPADVAMAEAAFTRAVKIAQHQQTRTFELRAALSLAKLYHSTDRPADAHAVLASAQDGFSPTPEFPEIAEAQTLLTALAP